MGVLDWLKRPEVAFLIGMPVGYVAIDYGRKKFDDYVKRTGEEIGRNIATAVRAQTNVSNEISAYQSLDKKLDSLLSKVSEIEKKVYKEEKS